MEILNIMQSTFVAGARGACGPAYAGAGARQSQQGGGSGNRTAGSNGNDDIYAGTDDCVISIGSGALGGIKGEPGGAFIGDLSNGYSACIGSSNNGTGGGASQSGAGNCSGGIGGVCN